MPNRNNQISPIQRKLIPIDGISSFSSTRHSSLSELQSEFPSHYSPIITMSQVHSAAYQVVDAESKSPIENVDALISTSPGVPIAAKSADCLPILISHPAPLVAAIHAGRRGTESGITSTVINAIQSMVDTDEALTIWLGPRICYNCYEINPDTQEHFDLISKNIAQINDTAPNACIIDSQQCTACNPKDFYSYRKGDLSPQNRLLSIICID